MEAISVFTADGGCAFIATVPPDYLRMLIPLKLRKFGLTRRREAAKTVENCDSMVAVTVVSAG